jgi:hypothetical protein
MTADTSIHDIATFKGLAKALKRALQVKHSMALELLARADGFANYHEVSAIARDGGKLPVRRTVEQVAANLKRIARERATQEDGVDALKEVAALCEALCAATELREVCSKPVPAVRRTELSASCVGHRAVAFSDGRRMEVCRPVTVSYRRCRRAALSGGRGAMCRLCGVGKADLTRST